ncbi:hypothetical protein [Caldimonas sp.]|uniref:hypothetical protein n=1 Tax=Caldimonas sp. TaxID=2838790 RepID=UPI00391B6DCD
MKKQPLCFSTPPGLGARFSLEGQSYVLIKTQPHIRRDGKPSVILTWRSQCLSCGADFEFTTGLSLLYVNRRCPAHHAPGRRPRAQRAGGAQ